MLSIARLGTLVALTTALHCNVVTGFDDLRFEGGGAVTGGAGAAGLGGAGPGGAGGGSCMPPIAPGCEEYAQAYCAKETSCSPYQHDPSGSCEVTRALACTTAMLAPGTGMTEDLLSLCTLTTANQGCQSFREAYPFPECAFDGLVPDGAVCVTTAQCVRGSECEVCGSCVPRGLLGAQCGGSGGLCLTGLTCTNGLCGPYLSEFESCGPQLECSPVYFCNENSLCELKGMPGSTCVVFSTCDAGLTCPMGTCLQSVGAANGQPCNLGGGTPCAAGICEPMTFICRPFLELCEPCTPMAFPGCRPPAQCSDSVCRIEPVSCGT